MKIHAIWALRIGLGWIYYEEGDHSKQAQEEFQNAIDIDKARGEGYFAMALMLTREDRFDEADAWYNLALERNQAYSGWYIARANNLSYSGKLNLALSYYHEAAAKFPEDATVYYEMAWAYRLNNQPEEAITTIKKAVSIMKPPNALYYLRTAQIYEWDGKNDLALDAYKKALAIDPNNNDAQKGINQLGTP